MYIEGKHEKKMKILGWRIYGMPQYIKQNKTIQKACLAGQTTGKPCFTGVTVAGYSKFTALNTEFFN